MERRDTEEFGGLSWTDEGANVESCGEDVRQRERERKRLTVADGEAHGLGAVGIEVVM